MTTALTVGVPSPQATAPTAGGRTPARRGGDGPSAGAGGFDAVMADHTALPKPLRQAKVKPSPEAQTGGADKHGVTPASSPAAVDPADPIAVPVTPASSPAAVDPADPIAVPVIPASSPAAVGPAHPIARGLGVGTVPPTPVRAATASTATDAPASVPGMPPANAKVMSAADHVVAVPGHADTAGPGGTLPETLPIGQDVAVATASISSQPRQGAAAAATAGAPIAAGSGVVPEPSTPAPATRSTTLAAPTLSSGTGSAADPPHPIAAEVSASVARAPIAPGPGVVPAPSTPAAPATTSTTLGAQPEAAAPILAQGKGSADLAAATTTAATPADGAARGIPGSTGHGGPGTTTVFPVASDPVSVDQVPSGQPVVVATASSSIQPRQGQEPMGAGGAPTAPALGVVPPFTGPVPPAAMSTASAAPAMGQPASLPLPAAHQQVLTAVSPLLRRADGNYAIELQLHPKDLGAVQVTVDVRHGEISIQMHAADAAARDALRSGLSDLRAQLEDQGLRAGSMEVGSGGANARQPQTSWSRSEGIEAPERSPVPPDPLVAPAVGASSTSLDLRM